ncbi:MAG: 3D domain-containing protein [Candidatus Kerfeldbacteria bacterium]|nr:3D domain-containing protein [Candidatus Kerfeldbacteria bacterium]
MLRVVATAYTSSPDETDSDPFTTASGAKTGDGVIAVNGLPFGTKVKIPDVYGDKEFVVLDRMAPRHGRNRIDIWMPSKHQAKNWGVRTVMVEIQ